jgi:nitric oxide reductase NorQ protein
MQGKEIIEQFRVPYRPNYIPQGNEEEVFRRAFETRIPLILKGPTGCGKTRFVEHMAYELGLPLVTVSCHEDLTASDLVGRYLLKDNQTVWQDGPLTLAVRYGAICYLDEIVEARNDTTVLIHSLTDDRRILYVDKTGEVVRATDSFLMVLSYNPGYQNVVKDLKHSTKQRFASLAFDHPQVDTEVQIIETESGLDAERSRTLAEMGQRIRLLKGFGLDEGVSSRLLVYVGRLMQGGLDPLTACRCAISQTLSDEPEIIASVEDLVRLHFGDVLEDQPAAAQDAQAPAQARTPAGDAAESRTPK